MLQKESNAEEDNFLIFLAGELIGDIFSIVLNILKVTKFIDKYSSPFSSIKSYLWYWKNSTMAGMQKPVSKESVAIMGECLRIFVLLQTLSKVGECQRGFMSLLLEAVIVIFSIREVDSSEVLLIYVIIFKNFF